MQSSQHLQRQPRLWMAGVYRYCYLPLMRITNHQG